MAVRPARSPRFDPQHPTKLTVVYTHSLTPPGRIRSSELQLYSKFEVSASVTTEGTWQPEQTCIVFLGGEGELDTVTKVPKLVLFFGR